MRLDTDYPHFCNAKSLSSSKVSREGLAYKAMVVFLMQPVMTLCFPSEPPILYCITVFYKKLARLLSKSSFRKQKFNVDIHFWHLVHFIHPTSNHQLPRTNHTHYGATKGSHGAFIFYPRLVLGEQRSKPYIDILTKT